MASRSTPAATTTASWSGWRSLTFAVARARSPSATASRATAHVTLELEVARRRLGPVAQMDRRLGAVEVLVDLVRDERREGRQQLGDRLQRLAQRAQRAGVALPEPPARAPDIPVGQVVDELADRAPRERRVVVVQPRRDLLDGRADARADPAVQVGLPAVGLLAEGRVARVERVDVPELTQEQPHALADGVHREAVPVPRLLGGEEVPAERVGAEALQDIPGHHDVALGLRHLLPLAVEDQAEAHDVAVRRLIAEEHRDRVQRVEPPARLVDRLADEVRRVLLLELVGVLERRVPLRERHRPRVEPHVDDLGHATSRLARHRAREGDVVDVRPVRVGDLDAGELLELGEGPDDRDVAVLVAPDGQRRAPVALPRERPVDVARQPVAEAPVLDVLRVPGDLLVGGHQAVAQGRGRDVPSRLGVVDERVPRAPAVRVGVLELLGAQDALAALQIGDEVGVGLLDVAPGVLADPLVVGPVGQDRVDDRQAVALAEPEVVLAERDRRVHEAGAVVGRHEVGEQDRVAALAPLAGPRGTGRAARSARRPAPRRGSGRAPGRPRRGRAR